MNVPAPARRWVIRGGTAVFATTVLVASAQFAAVAASRPAPTPRNIAAAIFSSANPYSPTYHHAYRKGAVPTLARLAKMAAWAKAHPGAATASSKVRPAGKAAISSEEMTYGGGIDGIGVTSGPEKIYLVFYGSQWGNTGTNSNGDTTLSGDPNGEGPYLQQLFKGLGTGGELWSGVMTQYCDGVAVGASTCPASNQFHVGYPTGGPLAGVWVDESTASPAESSGHQLALEAIAAAAHFGNTTAASNRYAQYDILSPTGTDPDGWLQNGFCAWHDYNGDTTLSGGAASSPYGDIAFTNMPYVTDAGASCGENFINGGSAGLLDGASIVNGHEYAETITDQNPPGGYVDALGEEVGDVCAWDEGPGAAAADLSLPTGSFAMQSIWGNDGAGGAGTCEFSHAIVTNGGGGGGNTITVTNPGNQSTVERSHVSLQIVAKDSASGQTLTYAATGLPSGLSINSSSGLITGTAPRRTSTHTVKITVTDLTGAQGSTSFTWKIIA